MPKNDKRNFDFLSSKEENPVEETPINITEKIRQGEPTPKKRQGKVLLIIVGNRIIVEYKGTGESIPYDADKHANLKIGDPIEI